MNIKNRPSHFVAPTYQKKVVDPDWDYEKLPAVGECWLIRSAEHQNPPMVAFCTQIVTGKVNTIVRGSDGVTESINVPGMQILFLSTYVSPKKQGLYIKDKEKNTFHNSTVRHRVTAGIGVEGEINGVKCYEFKPIAMSDSYVRNQMERKMAVKLNKSISEIWKNHYIKFKFIAQNIEENKVVFPKTFKLPSKLGEEYGTQFIPDQNYPNIES